MSTTYGFGLGLILGSVGWLIQAVVSGRRIMILKQTVTYWKSQAAKSADEANDLHGRNVALDRELLVLQAEVHFAETGAGLSDAQADALDDHWRTAVDASMLRAVGDVIKFPTQRTASE